MMILLVFKYMKICLYPGGIDHLRMGGIKTAFENKKKAFELLGIPYSFHPFSEPFDILQLECPSPQSAMYALWAKKNDKYVVMSTHVTVEDYKETFAFSKATSSFLESYLRWYYSHADLLIAPSEYTKKLVQGYGVERPIKVISNGLHPSFLNDSTSKKINKKDKPVIGAAGFVTKRKGVLTFCDVARDFPGCVFNWAGSVHDNLLFDIQSMEIPDNVRFLGFVKDIKEVYTSFDYFLFPSYEENQGIVLLEAASFGLPLIVRDLPVYSGWLIDGQNCLKCKSDQDFKEKLRILLKDDTLKMKLSKNARVLAEANDLQIIGKQIVACYDVLLQN
jgi:1,2-diacylglycerol-3-alpha-glucose alpha-1,2-glucosyltransferase